MFPVQSENEILKAQIYRTELDLEISLRERLQKTIEGRIQWATLLQTALTKNETSSVSSSAFKDAALEALNAIEQPSSVLFDLEEPSLAQTAALTPLRTRLPPVDRENPRVRTRKPAQFVYIRVPKSDSDNELQPMILRCPECLKSSFSSLQGLYNHARITHRLEWGNHEECIRATAYPMEPVEIASLDQAQEVGAASLPGVRTLFQRAVAEGRVAKPLKVEHGDMEVDQQPISVANHLSLTLGLHEDTPALAQFLGKEAKRREIKSKDEDEHVDVLLLENGATPAIPRNAWRMPFFQRGVQSTMEQIPEADFAMTLEDLPESKPLLENSTVTRMPQSLLPESRFHIVSRIVVGDKSFFIPPDKRTSGHTHKWMLSVTSPSYSNDITTILNRMEVFNATDSSQFPVLAASEPPFLVVGTASAPFLAKIALYFVGSGERAEQMTTLEHWTELDVLSRANPVDGEEQIVDINLDKTTILLPAKKGYEPHNSRIHWGLHEDRGQIAEKSERGYSDLLTDLLPRFPMVGKRKAANLPYRLCSTLEELSELVMGRRKVIEWGRARALCNAYNAVVEKPIPLTAADVYCWLADEGHFIRPAQQEASLLEVPPSHGRWCGVCGFLLDLHHPSSDEIFECSIVPNILVHRKLAIQDISVLLPAREYTEVIPQVTPPLNFHSRTIIRAAGDGAMISSVRNIVAELKLPAFEISEHRLRTMSWSETDVAPFGLLAIAMKVFVKRLVQGGLGVSSRDSELAKAFGVKPKKSQRNVVRLLTPIQILNGLVDGKDKGKVSSALYEALARVGIATTSHQE